MRAIRDISALAPGAILYHPAFGFARIASVEGDRARLRWEREAPNLPSVATLSRIAEVCSLCQPDGFFARSLAEASALTELGEQRPAEVVRLLLTETVGPMSFGEIRHWLVERRVVEPGHYESWWRQVQLHLHTDARFVVSQGQLALRHQEPDDDDDGLELTAEELLAGALEERDAMPADVFLGQVVGALATGPAPVRRRALEALADVAPDHVADRLLDRRPTPVDAVLEWLDQRYVCAPELATPHKRALIAIVAGKRPELDAAARGAVGATLVRSGIELWEVLGALVGTDSGRPVVHALLAGVDRDERLEWALDLWARLVDDSVARPGLHWLEDVVLELSGKSREALADQLDAKRPVLADRLRSERRAVSVRMPHLEFRPRGDNLLVLGSAMARALASHHADGRLVNPTRDAVHMRADGTLHLDADPDRVGAGRLPDERPSKSADVYSAAVVLLQLLLGRDLPERAYPFQLTRYLRVLVPDLPVGALAPLDAALHPEPDGRPGDGLAWMLRWQAAAMAHEARSEASWDAQVPAKLGYDSHIGRAKLLVTQTNQDAIYLATRGGLGLLVVCDGISTANVGSGDVASAISVYVMSKLFEQSGDRLALATDEDAEAFLAGAFNAANDGICQTSMRIAEGDLVGRIPMGTTVVAALFRGNRVTIGWLGDSRAYLVGPYGADLLTADMNQSLDTASAFFDGESVRLRLGQFALTGYLGHFADEVTAALLPPRFVSTTMLPAERLLLCSDGVTDYIAGTHPELASRLTLACQRRDPDEAARFLTDLANQGGGGDNCTAIVATLWHA